MGGGLSTYDTAPNIQSLFQDLLTITSEIFDAISASALVSQSPQVVGYEGESESASLKLVGLYQRRADCFLRLNQPEEALSDCLLARTIIQTTNRSGEFAHIPAHLLTKIFVLAAAATLRLSLLPLAKEFIDVATALQPLLGRGNGDGDGLHVEIATLRKAILANEIPIASNAQSVWVYIIGLSDSFLN